MHAETINTIVCNDGSSGQAGLKQGGANMWKNNIIYDTMVWWPYC